MTVRRVGAREALSLLEEEGYVYVDVRSIPEFEAGHPSGAYNVPYAHAGPSGMEPNLRFVADMTSAFGRGRKLILGCQAGARSLAAARVLLEAGFQEVVEQRAGWGGVRDPFGGAAEPGWQREGLPQATSAEPGRSYADLMRADRRDSP